MSASSLCTPLADFLTASLGEQYGRIGELIRDELGIFTLKQAQTSLDDSDLVEVRERQLRSRACVCVCVCVSVSGQWLTLTRFARVPMAQLSKLTPIKVAHRKVLLNAVRNASREELTITSFDGLPWRGRAAVRTLSVRLEGSEKIVSVVVQRDATVQQIVSAAQRATRTDGDLLVWDGRRQARTKLAPRHLRLLRKADPLVLVPLEPAAAPPPGEGEWADGGGWSDDELELQAREPPVAGDAASDDDREGQMMDVKCPAGAAAGAVLMVTSSWGNVMQVIVPPGVEQGDTFEVLCTPTPSAPAPAPSLPPPLPQPATRHRAQHTTPRAGPQPPPPRPAPMTLSGKGQGGAQPWKLAADLQESELAMDKLQETLADVEKPTNVEILKVTCPEGATAGDVVTVRTSWGEMMDVEVPAGIAPGETFEVPSWAVLSSSGSPQSAVAGSIKAVSPPRKYERKPLDENEVARLHQVQRQKGRQDALFRAMLRNDSPPEPHPQSSTSYLTEELIPSPISPRLSELATPRPRQIKEKFLVPKPTEKQAKTGGPGTAWKSPPPAPSTLTKLRTKPKQATLEHLETFDEWQEEKRMKIESKRKALSQLPRHRTRLTKAQQKQLVRRLYEVR